MEKISNVEISEMFNKLFSNNMVDPQTKDGFLTSIHAQFVNKGYLTSGQFTALQRIAENYSFDASDWRNDFLNSDKKQNFKIVVDYYRMTNYFGNIIAKVNKDAGYIPSPKEYSSICENKYAKMVIDGTRGPAKYKLGDMIRLRKQNHNLGIANVYGIGTILEIMDYVKSSCNGNKIYKVYFAEVSRTIEIEERKIALAKDRDYDKIAEEQNNRSEY